MLIVPLLVSHSVAATISVNALAAWEKDVQAAREEAADYSRAGLISEQSESEGATFEGSASPQVSGTMKAVSSGLIHHWTGMVFLPNIRVCSLLAVLQNYSSYADLYAPVIVESKLLSRHERDFIYQLKFIQHEFGVTAGLLGTFRTTYSRSSEIAGYSLTEATQLVELQDPGTVNERPMSLSESHGFVQKTFIIMRYQQVDSGVLVRLESLVLSRGAPPAIRWIIAPLIERMSRCTMTRTLQQLKNHLGANRSLAAALAPDLRAVPGRLR